MLLLIFLTNLILSHCLNDWYYDNWCGEPNSLQYLDDSECVKVFPSNYDRQWTCPSVLKQVPSNGFIKDGIIDITNIDFTTLSSVVNTGANACVIITERVLVDGVTTLYNKYLCSDQSSALNVHETWSSSKIFAMSNAAGHLRSNESTCSSDIYGINSFTSGNAADKIPLGDLATIICSYDATAGYSSNGLSSYFHDIGWRGNIHELVNSNWLGLENCSLGGNYGVATPSDLSFNLNTATDIESCSVDVDPWPVIYDNSLSVLAAAEMTRRIVQHREIDPSLRFPYLTWEDVKNILLGSDNSILFPELLWGGMSTDTAIFLQSAVNITEIEENSQGKWRIFSKLGAGYSTLRSRGEIITNAYGCFPTIDEVTGEVIDSFEVTLSIRGSVPYDGTLLQCQSQVITAMKEIMSILS